MAQWIRHLTTNQGIPGSSPGRVALLSYKIERYCSSPRRNTHLFLMFYKMVPPGLELPRGPLFSLHRLASLHHRMSTLDAPHT